MQNKVKIIIYTLSILLLSFTNAYSSETKLSNPPEMKDARFACKTFFENLAKSENSTVRNFYTYAVWNDFGFYFKEVFDVKEYKFKTFKDKDNNLVVGSIYNFDTASKINVGDSILSINNKRITSEQDFLDILFDKNLKEIKINLLNKKAKEYEVELKKSRNDYRKVVYRILNFNITDVDIKKGTYDLSIRHNFAYSYRTRTINSKENHAILDTAIGTIIYFNQDQEKHMYHICEIPEKVLNDATILVPEKGILINNVLRNDKDLELVKRDVTPYHLLLKNDENEVSITTEKFNVFKIKNNFNLKSFPFDKQFIKYQVIDNAYLLETRIIGQSHFTYLALNKFMAEDDVPGWKKKSYRIDSQPFKTATQYAGTYSDSYIVSIELERKPGYYIFKVIFPILLILLICWSVVWVDPKELESRLTITIVCLLSLIAYNFVIDSELPKLEYLTVLDWIILISYFYATIPNLLSVVSFRLLKTNLPLGNKIELISKKYGLASYMAIIFAIILINVNANSEHSAHYLAWMKLN
jgi:hypothetical protein